MSKKKKTIVAFLGSVVLLFSTGFYYYLHTKIPMRQGRLHLAGIKENVSVHFDHYGVPHIYAKHEADGYKALGYVHAQDRLFQMEMLRRIAKGQLSEIFGKEFISIDKFFRTLRIRHYVKKYVDRLSPYSEVSLLSQAYIDGVNQFIKEGPNPIEFDLLGIHKTLFSLEDSICISAYMAYTFAPAFKVDPLLTYIRENLGLLWLRDIKYNDHNLQSLHLRNNNQQDLHTLVDVVNSIHTLTGAEFFSGSNAWVLSGKKTKSGYPILANDPHIQYGIPPVWYEAHLVTDRVDLYGHYIAGLPMAILGHTPDMAWGITMFQNDDVDLFRERINPKSPEQIWVKDKWETLQSEEEIIKVKGEKSISFPVRFSKRGPIINDIILSDKSPKEKKDSEPISLWWAFFESSNDVLSAFYELPRTKALSEVQSHIEKIQSPGLNIVYADKAGNIAWYAAAKIPKREKNINPSFILNGETTKPYTSFKPFSENPSSVNPPEGFIVSANEEPQSQEPIPGYYAKKFRFQKITNLLQQKSDWTSEEVKKIQLDDVTTFQNQILPYLVDDLKSFDIQNEAQQKALEVLLNWKGEHKFYSNGPVIFYQFISLLIQEIFSKKLPPKLFDALVSSQLIDETLVNIIQNDKSVWWGQDENGKAQKNALAKKRAIQITWQKTVETLIKLFGHDVKLWTWDKFNILEHRHPLGRTFPLNYIFNIGPFPMEGGREVINNQFSNLYPGIRHILQGPSTRRIIDLQDSSRSFGINSTGQSGYFLDKHYHDQANLYHSSQYRLQLTNKEEIEKISEEVLIFYP